MAQVVKIGGSDAIEPGPLIRELSEVAERKDLVVVHGGSGELDRELEALGKEPEYVKTPGGMKSRFTDERTMEVFKMVMAGKINVNFTALFQDNGVEAVGVSGVDAGLLRGPRKSAVKIVEDGRKKIRRGEHSGKVEKVNSELLEMLLESGYTPVISLPMLADDGTPVNADGDRAAAAVAGAMEAKLLILTDVPGVLEDPEDEQSLIEEVSRPEQMEEAMEAAEGFMKKKVMAAREALESGASRVTVSGTEGKKPVANALEGGGTVFERGAV